MRRSEHPRSCRVCRGTGWAPGEPRHEIVAGRQHRYGTYRSCEHHWGNDDPGWEEPLSADSPRVAAILERAIEQGRRELAAMRGDVTETLQLDLPTDEECA